MHDNLCMRNLQSTAHATTSYTAPVPNPSRVQGALEKDTGLWQVLNPQALLKECTAEFAPQNLRTGGPYHRPSYLP